MKRTTAFFGFLLAGLILLHSQPLEKGLLWKIEGLDLASPSYLYGTFHLLCPDDLVITEHTRKAMDNCEQLVLELDFDDPGLMPALQQGMVLPDGQTAKDYLSEEEYSMVAAFFTEMLGMPFEALAAIKPFFLSAMTLPFFLECQPTSPEMSFTGMAKEQGMEVLGLETVQEQLDFVNGVPLEDAADMLIMSIEEAEDGGEMTSNMVRTYLEGDLEGIQKIIDEYMEDAYVDMNDELIISRNLDWIPKIEALISGKSSFIAVGAGHLPGEQGVIALLRQKGYSVEAVK